MERPSRPVLQQGLGDHSRPHRLSPELTAQPLPGSLLPENGRPGCLSLPRRRRRGGSWMRSPFPSLPPRPSPWSAQAASHGSRSQKVTQQTLASATQPWGPSSALLPQGPLSCHTRPQTRGQSPAGSPPVLPHSDSLARIALGKRTNLTPSNMSLQAALSFLFKLHLTQQNS